MYQSKIFVLFVACYNSCVAYIRTSYDSTNFFNNFVFETIADPTHGTVKYIDYTTASSTGLATYVNNKVHLGVGKLSRSYFSMMKSHSTHIS